MTKAIYAFSGDPITYGHIDIINRAAEQFDEVVVAIGVNPDKVNKYMFTLEERTEMAQKALANKRNVSVTSFEGMLPYFAYEQDIPVIIRGIRNSEDVEEEKKLRAVIDSQKLGIDVIPLLAKPELEHISSSTVKAVQVAQGMIQDYVPLNVKQNLEARVSGQYIVGITGEIGSGKSYVSEKLVELAEQRKMPVHYIDMDKIGHQILGDQPEPAYQKVRKEVADAFGSHLRRGDGSIDRKALRDIVFSDAEKLKKLNEIMQKPLQVQLSRKLYGRKGLIFLEAALFAENKANYLCNNNIILVNADEKSTDRRLTEKRDMTAEDIAQSRARQYDFDKKYSTLKQATELDSQGKLWVYDNSDDSDSAQLEVLFKDIVKYADKYGELRFRALWNRVGAGT
jgi:pantetheine-phosphate adenylyltransferase